MQDQDVDPLFGEVPERVQLSNAPLVSVLGQTRFTPVAKISDEGYIADFQEAIREKYPYFQSDTIQGVDIMLAGNTVTPRQTSTVVWRFFDAEKIIRVTLGQDQISLETRRYTSRIDFLERLRFLLDKLNETVKPSLAQRVGFRYVDRITSSDLSQLGELIRPPMLNIAQPDLLKHIDVSMSEITASTAEGKLIARYGLAPPNYTHDPEMAPHVNEKSWVLDVDSFSVSCAGKPFDTDMLCGELANVSARAYAFFRWSVTENFLEHFGATKDA